QREGLDGWWTKTFPVEGGKHYRVQAFYRARGVATPRRSIVVKLNWRDAKGNQVALDDAAVSSPVGATPMAEAEFPTTRAANAAGWTEVSDTYRAPSRATQAVVELHLQWSRDSEVRWSGVTLAGASPPAPRKVRL